MQVVNLLILIEKTKKTQPKVKIIKEVNIAKAQKHAYLSHNLQS